MNKLQKTLLIILLIALLLAAACITAGALLGAHPLEIAGQILRDLAARANINVSEAFPNVPAWTASLSR